MDYSLKNIYFVKEQFIKAQKGPNYFVIKNKNNFEYENNIKNLILKTKIELNENKNQFYGDYLDFNIKLMKNDFLGSFIFDIKNKELILRNPIIENIFYENVAKIIKNTVNFEEAIYKKPTIKLSLEIFEKSFIDSNIFYLQLKNKGFFCIKENKFNFMPKNIPNIKGCIKLESQKYNNFILLNMFLENNECISPYTIETKNGIYNLIKIIQNKKLNK